METKIIFSGFGGQGVLTLGQFVAYAALLQEKQVTWMPSYGAEMRGGTANCSIVVSDHNIGSPIVGYADVLVAMNKPSILKFESKIKQNGIIIMNSSLIDDDAITREDIKIIKIPASDIAIEIGNAKVANMIMCGALIKYVPDLLDVKTAEAIMAEKFTGKKAKFIPMNKIAIQRGQEF